MARFMAHKRKNLEITRIPRVMAKDCDVNKMRVIVNFRNRDTLLLF